jgi:membrane protein DedA with SNARE-associated domain
VTSILAHHGVLAVFVLMAIDAVLPAASELVMVYAGALASGALAHHVHLFGHDLGSGFWPYLAMALAGTIGYLLGAIGGWAIGYYGGRPFLERRGRWFHLTPARLARAERWFERWEDWAVLVGRVTPVARSFVSIPAGVFEAPLPRYTVLTAIGNAVWCFALAGAGWALGSSWERFHHDFRFVDYGIALLVVAGVAYWLLRRRRSSTMPRRGGDTAR